MGGKRKSARGLDLDARKEVRDLWCALVVPSESVLEELSYPSTEFDKETRGLGCRKAKAIEKREIQLRNVCVSDRIY